MRVDSDGVGGERHFDPADRIADPNVFAPPLRSSFLRGFHGPGGLVYNRILAVTLKSMLGEAG